MSISFGDGAVSNRAARMGNAHWRRLTDERTGTAKHQSRLDQRIAYNLFDLHHNSPAHPSLDDAPACLDHAREIDLAGHRGEFARVEMG